MASYLIDTSTNDYKYSEGYLEITPNTQTLLAQNLRQKLKTFTNTLYTNIDYGLDSKFLTEPTDKVEFDQHIKGLVLEEIGIQAITKFSSKIDEDHRYSCTFTAISDESELIPVEARVGYNNPFTTEGLWVSTKVNPWGVLINEEVVGET